MALIDNLGDYNLVRIDLQNANGSREKLYKQIGDIAVAKAAPKLILVGSVAALGICKGIEWLKARKELLESEERTKKEFSALVATKENDGDINGKK